MSEPERKIIVDADWKAQAQAEKQRLVLEEEETKAELGDRPQTGLPPQADFKALMGVLASQAIMGLGALGDQKTGRIIVDLPGAKFSIDLLEVLQDKSKGNLSDEEAKELDQILVELRARYVQISNMVTQQAVAGPDEPGKGVEKA